MALSAADSKSCAICSARSVTEKGHVIFVSECSHSFHLGCISNYVVHGNNHCPICHAKWNHLPFKPELTTEIPLPEATASSTSLQKVSIKAIPERSAIATFESIAEFPVLVGLKAPSLSNDFHRAHIDLVTVLDVSSSMQGSKLALVKRAVEFVIDNLGPSDRLSIVSFSNNATRILHLCNMTEDGRRAAKQAINSIEAQGCTNIVDGLRKGVEVLEERREKNPVSSIIFLSDGNDNCNPRYDPCGVGKAPLIGLLPTSICPRGLDKLEKQTFPVHAFGFGTDHDPTTMHAISEASGGTFSFVESYEIVQDAFASCIGGLLSLVTQNLQLTIKAASLGVEIKSISSGRYSTEISENRSVGKISAKDMYAEENREFLVILSVPRLLTALTDEGEKKTPLLDISCSYKDAVSKEIVNIEYIPLHIRRPKFLSADDMVVNIEVERQKNRVLVAESIAKAQKMAEAGNLKGARSLLAERRSYILDSDLFKAGDSMFNCLESDMKEMENGLGSMEVYERSGRAFFLSGMSAHDSQRQTSRGKSVDRNAGAYGTPFMREMVNKSQQVGKTRLFSTGTRALFALRYLVYK